MIKCANHRERKKKKKRKAKLLYYKSKTTNALVALAEARLEPTSTNPSLHTRWYIFEPSGLHGVFAMFKFWFRFVVFYSPDLKKQTRIGFQNRTKSAHFFYFISDWIWLLGFRNGRIVLLARRTRIVPDELTHRVSNRRIRTANSSSEKEGSSRGRWFASHLSHQGMAHDA